MQEMERLQAKGEIPQEELAALESDMTVVALDFSLV